MKKIILISLVIFLSNCAGYKPIFTSDQTNFYIEKIEISDDNKLVRKLVKNLKPYSIDNGKQSITLKLDLNKQENVIMKDAKGDPASYEIKIKLNVDVITKDGNNKLNFEENFTFNNQSNKFELNQYKKNTETNLINKIFENLILELRAI
jgi:hypothetical protein|tara:strand:- start:1485 stop:1934 length:450 start_codon:yes stop_codon:yes gene_type:complete